MTATRFMALAKFFFAKRSIILSIIICLMALLASLLYQHFFSVTKVALVGYSDFQIARLAKNNDGEWLTIERLAMEKLEHSKDFDAILLFGRGLALSSVQKKYLETASNSGTSLYVEAAMHKGIDVSNLEAQDNEAITAYLRYGGDTNFRNLLAYIRYKLDGKSYGSTKPDKAVARDNDVLFYLKDEQIFSTLPEYETFYERQPSYHKQGKKVALLTSVPGPFNSNRDHVDQLINEIESRGLRVYPIASHGRRLEILKSLRPDVVVFLPHGRLHRGRGKATIDWLKHENIPLFSPLSVFQRHEEWLEDAQGFSGGMLTMNVVLPELDGGVLPKVINAQFVDKDGYQVFRAIDGRLESFVDQLQNWLKLKHEENANKKVAVVYFRGPGKNALVAGNLEVTPSLYNFLKRLDVDGYTLTGLPSTFGEFETLLASQGQVMAPYAPGLVQEFLRKGNPALIDAKQYKQWCMEVLAEGRCQEISKLYGAPPGQFMVTEHNGKSQIGVARLQFGNVVILPQPLPGLGDNSFKLVHGTDQAPPHSYAAVYLWIREMFKADAIMHFGTHGSLEFTPSKQVALSERDWSDALIGDIPHSYLYTVSNVGEAIIAKRRSYATIISHLTPPFKEGGLYTELKQLDDELKAYAGSRGQLKNTIRTRLIDLAKKIGLDKDLNINLSLSSQTDQAILLWDKDVYSKLSEWLETLAQAKITEGLYTLDTPYQSPQVDTTAQLMVLDALEQNYQELKRDAEKAFNVSLTDYTRDDFKRWIQGVIDPQSVDNLLAEILPEQLRRDIAAFESLAPEEPKLTAPHAEREPTQESGSKLLSEQKNAMAKFKKIRALLLAVPIYRGHLAKASSVEVASIVNSLAGGYTEPSSGGDPIVNPQSLPTGRNMFSIDAERTPSAAAWSLGKGMAEALLKRHQEDHGQLPKKISFTLWPSEFIHTQGATIAEILYLLGVEPIRDPFGRVLSLRLIPTETLGRARIDVVIQSAGQLRDLAASRLQLIEQAVVMAAAAQDSTEGYENYVAKGVRDAEKYLLDNGVSPARARGLSTRRSFGGLNGAYGTGIMGLVESGSQWQTDAEIGKQYIHNMGASYGKTWGEYEPHLFAAALLNTEVVVQPRSSNTWGALSLDHVYEFMGGLNLAVRTVTGNDPAAYFNDFRNPNRGRLQSHNEAVWEEARSTVLNPSFIKSLTEGGSSSAETFAETLRNTFGWNVMKPEGIDDSLWDQLHEVYVRDIHELDLREFFERENPYALQEVTGVMLEAARKQLWQAKPEQLVELAKLHTQLVAKYEAGCGSFTCGNLDLQAYIVEQLSSLDSADTISRDYQDRLDQAQTVASSKPSIVLKKQDRQNSSNGENQPQGSSPSTSPDTKSHTTHEPSITVGSAEQARKQPQWLVWLLLCIGMTVVFGFYRART